MMHLKITDEIRERCLREAAHEAHINDRIVTSTPQTLAERGMTMLGSTRATPRKIGADYYIDDKALPPDLFVS